jgi:hypothetical protein
METWSRANADNKTDKIFHQILEQGIGDSCPHVLFILDASLLLDNLFVSKCLPVFFPR